MLGVEKREIGRMNEAYRRGLAYGVPQIKTDTIFFRYKEETFEFPAIDVLGAKGIAKHNGCYYEANVKKLRTLKAKHG